MSSVFKSIKYTPTKPALDIIRNIIATKGPIETKQLWEISQQVKPTPAELEQDSLERKRAAENPEFVTPGSVGLEKFPVLSRVEQKKDIKLQARLAKIERHDNGHPVQSVWCVETFDDFWPVVS